VPRTLSLHDRLTARACLPASSFAPKGITTLTQHDGTEKAKTFASKYTLNQFIQDLAEVTEKTCLAALALQEIDNSRKNCYG
jgi:hypothetical protein